MNDSKNVIISSLTCRLLFEFTVGCAPFAGTSEPYPKLSPEELPDPPGMFETIVAMASGGTSGSISSLNHFE